MLFQAKCQQERTVLEQTEQRILRPGKTGEQIDCLGQNRLTNEQWRVKLIDPIGGPAMVWFRPIEESDQRASISDGSHRARSPQGAPGSKRDEECQTRPRRVLAPSGRPDADDLTSRAALRGQGGGPPRSGP